MQNTQPGETGYRPLPQKIAGLEQYTGTENYWRYQVFPQFNYTDGVREMANVAGAYWLLDMVFMHTVDIYNNSAISDYDKSLLVCKLQRAAEGNAATFTVQDGNYNELARQEIEFTDFPAMEQTVWVQRGVAMLPSEY